MKKKPTFDLRIEFLLFTALIDKCFNFKAPRYGFKPLASASGPHLQNLRFAIAPAFLEYFPNQTRQEKTL